VDGHYLEGFWRAHQVPLTDVATNVVHLRLLESWMRSYKPEERFVEQGRLIPDLKALAPKGNRRMSAIPWPMVDCFASLWTCLTSASTPSR